MANGPLGGFMPTPPSPGQPPQVKLDTSAESRGTFNKFLGTLPKNGAIAPIQTGVMQSSTAPVSPMTSNVNIFQPQMSQMTPMPMMPPAQPVQMMQPPTMMADGGNVAPRQTEIMGQPHMLAYITPQESNILEGLGGANEPGPMGIPSFFVDDFGDFSSVGDDAPSVDTGFDDSGNNFDEGFTEEEDPSRAGDYQTDDSGIFTGTGGDDSPAPVIDTRPRTNIRNVGARSNLRFDPQFTANLLQQRGLDPQGFMSPSDFQQTTQGGGTGTAQTLSSGLPSLGLGQNLLGAKPTISRQDVLAAQNRLSDIAPAATVPLAPASPFFDRDLLDDPLGLGVRTGFGPAVDAIEEGRARATAFPSRGTQVAGLPSVAQTIVPSAGGVQEEPGLAAFGGFGDPVRPVESIEDDLIAGRGKGTNINNPGNIRAGGGFDGEIGTTKDGFAIFDNLQSGVNAINTLTNTYGSKRNVDTVREYANRYSPVGENTAKEVAGKINVLSSALGVGPDDKVDFTDPAVQSKLTPAVMTTEIGADKTKDVLNVLSGFSPTPLARDQVTNFNPNLTTPVNQLGTLDPVDPIQEAFRRTNREGVELPSNISFRDLIQATTPGTPEYEATKGGDLTSIISPPGSSGVFGTPLMERNLQQTTTSPVDQGIVPVGEFDVASPAPISRGMQDLTREDENLARIEREQQAIQDARNTGRPTFNLGPGQPGVDIRGPLTARLASVLPDQALETLAGRRDRLPDQVFDIDTRDTRNFVGDDFAPALDIADKRLEDLRQRDINVREMDAIDRLTAGKPSDRFAPEPPPIVAPGIEAPNLDPNVSIVGDDEAFAELNLADIQGNINQERVADILNRPDRFKETFKIGDAEFPNLIATLANKAGSFFDRRLFDGIVSKGLDAVVDPDTGRIIGAKDEFGNLIEGRDLEQFQAGDDNEDPVTKFLKKTTEEKDEEEDEKPPNVIGGTTPTEPTPRSPTVVKSTAPASTASFTPVDFNAGNLNDLIARITGVPTPRRLQDGGQVEAVDRFLTKVA